MSQLIEPSELDHLYQQFIDRGLPTVMRALDERLDQQPDDTRSGIASQNFSEMAAAQIQKGIAAPGDQIPDFALPDAFGNHFRLEQLVQSGPLVLVFYRGAWCPFCDVHLRAFNDRCGEINQLGARVVSVSPQKPPQVRAIAARNDLQFPLLRDAHNQVGRALGLVFEFSREWRDAHRQIGIDLAEINGEPSWALPIPATFIIDQTKTVTRAWANVDYRIRVDPDEVILALKQQRSIRSQ